jgi:hypothetical protein
VNRHEWATALSEIRGLIFTAVKGLLYGKERFVENKVIAISELSRKAGWRDSYLNNHMQWNIICRGVLWLEPVLFTVIPWYLLPAL